MGRSGAFRYSVIRSGFANILQLKIFFGTQKLEKHAKNYVVGAPFPYRRGRAGVIGWIPILSDSFGGFREHSSPGHFLPKLQNSKVP